MCAPRVGGRLETTRIAMESAEIAHLRTSNNQSIQTGQSMAGHLRIIIVESMSASYLERYRQTGSVGSPAAARPDRPDRAKKQELLLQELQELLLLLLQELQELLLLLLLLQPPYTSNKKKEAKKNR